MYCYSYQKGKTKCWAVAVLAMSGFFLMIQFHYEINRLIAANSILLGTHGFEISNQCVYYLPVPI